MCLFSLIFLIVGLEFMNVGGYKGISSYKVFGSLIGFIVFFTVIMCSVGCVGFQMSKHEKPQALWLVVYGTLVFFLVMLPMFIQGSIILELQSVDETQINTICKMDNYT